MSVFFDWYNVMTYDYAGPLQPLSSGASCVQSTVASYLQGKTPASKIVVGVPSYAHTFAGVVFPSSLEGQPYGPGCSFSGAGYPGYYTGQAGMLAYYEVIGDLGCNVFQGTQVNPITETSYIWNGSTGAWG